MSTSSIPAVVPKRKSRRRWYWIGGFILILILMPVLVSVIAGWWSERQMQALYAEIEADDPDWRWHDLCAKIQPRPGEPNSAEQIAKVHLLLASKSFNLPPKWYSASNDKILAYRNSHLNPEQAQMLRNAFAALDPTTLAEARKLKDMPNGQFAFQATENPFTMRMDHVQHARAVMHLLECDAMLRGQDLDHDGAIQSCQALVNNARAIRDVPNLIGQLVRFAGHNVAFAAIERALGQGVASEETLKNLQQRLEAEADDDGLCQAMRGERAGTQQIYELLRDGKTSISEILAMMGAGGGDAERLLDAFPGLVLSGYPEYLRQMNEQVKLAKLKDPERGEAFHKFRETFRADRTTNLMVRILMPATQKVIESSQRSQGMLRTSIVAVAAERYRLKHEHWPSGMKELMHEGLIKEAYTDPYDGKPLRWKRTPTGIIIYTLGRDKIDDGGKLNRDNPGATGSDVGIELWDASLRRLAPPVIE